MTLPNTFGALTTANMTALDQNFAAVGALTVIPCGVTGTNTLSLSPLTNTPTVSSYANYELFSGIAAAANTGSVTAGVGGLATLTVFKDTPTGPQLLTGGEIAANAYFVLIYDSALSSGAGGFHIQTGIATAGGTYLPITGGTLTGSLTVSGVQSNGPVNVGGTLVASGFIVSASSIAAVAGLSGSQLQIAAGSPVLSINSATASLSFSILAAGASQDVYIAVPNCAPLNDVSLGLPSIVATGVAYNAFVSAPGTVTLRAFNVSSGTVTPTGGLYRATARGF